MAANTALKAMAAIAGGATLLQALAGGALAAAGEPVGGDLPPPLTGLASVTTSSKSVAMDCHLLLFYGRGETDVPGVASGEHLLRCLTDESAAIARYGSSPFVQTRSGLRYLLAKDVMGPLAIGEAHRDQALAVLAALEVPLTQTVAAAGRAFTLRDFLSESVANFTLDQGEIAWTAVAYARYLPPAAAWKNRFGGTFSFSDVAAHLLRPQRLQQSCGGIHIFHALLAIRRADDQAKVLNADIREALHSYIKARLAAIPRNQQADGSWGLAWAGETPSTDETNLQSRFLITGHLVDVLLETVDDERITAACVPAVEWLKAQLRVQKTPLSPAAVCPVTHALNGVRRLGPKRGERITLAAP